MEKPKIEKTYKRAFEMGYWLGRGKYDKFDEFIKSAEIHPEFQKGLIDGRKEGEQEIIRSAFRAVREQEENEGNRTNEQEQKSDSNSDAKADLKEERREKMRSQIKEAKSKSKGKDKGREIG